MAERGIHMTEIKTTTLSTAEEWLERLINRINDREQYTVDGSNLEILGEKDDAIKFASTAEINDRKEPVVILMQQKQNKIVVLRNFIQDCDCTHGLYDAVRMLDAGRLQSASFVQQMDYDEDVVYFPEYVCAKTYQTDEECTSFKEICVSVRNPIGWLTYGKYGTFLPMERWEAVR